MKRKKTEQQLHETDESSGESESEANDKATYKRKPTPKLRKYDKDYIKFGFVECASNSDRYAIKFCQMRLSNQPN